ncbi:MAG: PBP1A family penicillin-binding protein [Anaerolineae bacterium]
MNRDVKVYLLRKRRRPQGNKLGIFAGVATSMAASTVGTILLVITLVVAAALGSVVAVYAYFAKDLPDAGEIERVQEGFKTVRIYDRTGQHLLYEVADPGGDRTYVSIDQIPLQLRQATIAMEDKNFYSNSGIDLAGIARAFLSNLRGEQVQGGSTLTVQLVKNVLIPAEERYEISYARKIKEAILALEISRRYPGREGKDRILEWYLNSSFFGNHAYGVEAAAQVYFGKHVQELDLAECAMLVHIVQYPAMNPINNPDLAKRRQEIVLETMARQGYITNEEAYAAKQEELVIQSTTQRYELQAPHFAIYVRDLLEEQYGDSMYRMGLRVYTTLDWDIQNLAQEVATSRIAEIGPDHDATNAAVVVLRPTTGEILAMVGSVDYNNEEIDGEVNMALAPRQPGSSFKPYTYLAAFEQGYTAATMLMDIPTTFPNPPNEPYAPMNIDQKYHGAIRLRRALACSYNIPAVKLIDLIGVRTAVSMARRLGITTLNNDYYGLSVTLGAAEVRLLDAAFAYSVFANGGVMAGQPVPDWETSPGTRELEPVAILLIEDSQGNILHQYDHPETRQIVDPRTAYILQSILSDPAARAPAYGASGANLVLPDRPLAAKTGSTNENTDAWVMGFTPQYTVGVWIGNADRARMRNLLGSTGAGPIFHDIMLKLHEGQPVVPFNRPPGIVEARICNLSGQLATENCPDTVTEVFVEGTQPTVYCTMHQVFRINRETGRLATVYTPPELVEDKVFEIYPPEAADWVRENQIPQPPTEYDPLPEDVSGSSEAAIFSPAAYQYVKGIVDIVGNAHCNNFAVYRLKYGQGLNPSAWMTIGGDNGNQVDHGLLAQWDTTGLSGLYTIQLSVVDNGQVERTANVQVTVDNDPPQATLVHPVEGGRHSRSDPEAPWITIQVEAVDNVRMDRVEFFIDGAPVGFSTVSPFNHKVMLTDIAGGQHEIWGVGYDAAGNTVETAHVHVTVTG